MAIAKIVFVAIISLSVILGLYYIIKSLLINRYKMLAWQKCVQGKYIESIEYFNKITKLDSKNFVAYHYAGFAGSEIKDYVYTINMLNKALEIKPNSDDYYIRGIAKFNLKQYEAAIEDFDKCIDLYGENKLAYLYRGLSKILIDGDGLEDLELSIKNIKDSNLEFLLTYKDSDLQKYKTELFESLESIKKEKAEISNDIEKYIKTLEYISEQNK